MKKTKLDDSKVVYRGLTLKEYRERYKPSKDYRYLFGCSIICALVSLLFFFATSTPETPAFIIFGVGYVLLTIYFVIRGILEVHNYKRLMRYYKKTCEFDGVVDDEK